MIIETVRVSDNSTGMYSERERTGRRMTVRPEDVRDYPEIDGMIRDQNGHKTVIWSSPVADIELPAIVIEQ